MSGWSGSKVSWKILLYWKDVEQYTPAFEAKDEEAYGKDAELSDVKCDIIANTSGVDFSTKYSIGVCMEL